MAICSRRQLNDEKAITRIRIHTLQGLPCHTPQRLQRSRLWMPAPPAPCAGPAACKSLNLEGSLAVSRGTRRWTHPNTSPNRRVKPSCLQAAQQSQFGRQGLDGWYLHQGSFPDLWKVWGNPSKGASAGGSTKVHLRSANGLNDYRNLGVLILEEEEED